jgi:hypothetical protein
VGIALAALATAALSTWSLSFTIPGPTLGLLLLTAFFVGRGAAGFPARRATRSIPCRRSSTSRALPAASPGQGPR